MPESSSYLRPDNLDDALSAVATGDVVIAAGCTDLFPATERKILPGRVLDLTAIRSLRGISWDQGDLMIGAMTTWSDIAEAALPHALRGLQLAAREVGARQIQNQGTIAGNLCNASPAADGAPPLLTLDAEVELQSAAGARRLPLRDFLTGPRRTARTDDEIVTAVRIPSAALSGYGMFLKLGARAHLVISIAMTAARIDLRDGLVAEAALAVGACGPVATRLPTVERALIGAPLDPLAIRDEDVAAALAPIDDVRADAAYRLTSAAELLRRMIASLEPMAASS